MHPSIIIKNNGSIYVGLALKNLVSGPNTTIVCSGEPGSGTAFLAISNNRQEYSLKKEITKTKIYSPLLCHVQ